MNYDYASDVPADIHVQNGPVRSSLSGDRTAGRQDRTITRATGAPEEESMAKNVHLMAAVYENRDRGKVMLDTLQAMHGEGTITLVDAAMLTKDDKGKLHVEETAELTGREGATRGAIILGIVGLIYPPSFIATVIAGGGIGALAGKLRDTGIKKDQMREIADKITTEQAAVIALSEPESVAAIERALLGYEGELLTQELGPELSADLAAMSQESATNA